MLQINIQILKFLGRVASVDLLSAVRADPESRRIHGFSEDSLVRLDRLSQLLEGASDSLLQQSHTCRSTGAARCRRGLSKDVLVGADVARQSLDGGPHRVAQTVDPLL